MGSRRRAAPDGGDRVELFASPAGAQVVHTTVVGGVGGDNSDDLPALPVAHAVAANT